MPDRAYTSSYALEKGGRRWKDGGSGIRTHEGLIRTLPVFKTGAFNRSAIPPSKEIKRLAWSWFAVQSHLSTIRKSAEDAGHKPGGNGLLNDSRVQSSLHFLPRGYRERVY